jgi:TolB-like protein
MDFGAGWEISEASASTGAIAGTPLYLAPELLRGGEATIRSDVYSIGVLLYHMLTGTYPVRARDFSDLRLAHERRDRGDVLAIRRDVPRRLAGIIERAIDADAERRFESVDELATALGTLQPRRAVITLRYAIAIAATLAVGGLLLWQTSLVPSRSDGAAIAVLPLKNLSTEAGGEEFADGFTEEIINSLAANGHLRVKSLTSSLAFKDHRRDLRDVALRLDVNFVLDGNSIRRSGTGFRSTRSSRRHPLARSEPELTPTSETPAVQIALLTGSSSSLAKVRSTVEYDLSPARMGATRPHEHS